MPDTKTSIAIRIVNSVERRDYMRQCPSYFISAVPAQSGFPIHVCSNEFTFRTHRSFYTLLGL